MAEKPIGKITHYYDNILVAVINLDKGVNLKKGEEIHIKGKQTDFSQKVDSLQIDHKDVDSVKAGDSFGLKMEQAVKEADIVYKV
ncbi:MAG: hypothetical protein Q8P54_03200 [bacterium]|nr:hypothetical protein [bacterium]